MRKLYSLLLASTGWLLTSGGAAAQDWVEKLQNPNANFYEVQRAFNAHWANKEYERGKGWKQFKRIEHLMEPRVYPSGDRSLLSRNFEEFKKYERAQAMQKGAGGATTQGTTANWTLIGPTAVPTNGGGAGRINFIRFQPGNTSVMWVGTPAGGLWKTTTGGTSWSSSTDNLAVLGASDVVIDPANINTMYLATGDGEAGDTRSVGVLKSTNGGSTWATTGLSWAVSQNYQIRKLMMHPTNSSMVFAVTNGGVYRTLDAGATWTRVSTLASYDMEFKPGDPNICYISGSNSFYRSADGGATFTQVTAGIPTTNNRISIGVSAANANYVYLLCGKSSDSGFNGLYRSGDSGLTFAVRSTTPNILGWQANGSDAGGQSWYDLALAISPTNAEEVITGGVNVWRSTNGGSTWAINGHWTGTTASYIHADIHALEFLPGSGTTYFGGCDGGIFKKTSTTNWADLSANLQIAQLYKLGMSTSNASLVVSGWQDNGTNQWNGTGWSRVYGGDGMECFIDRTNNSTVYAELYYGDFKRSTNGGSTWTNIKPTAAGNGDWVTPWCQDPTAAGTIYGGFAQIWKSTNQGTSWAQLGTITGTGNFKSLAVAPSNSQVIYAARPTSIFKTTNGGTAWTSISAGLPTASAQITYIAVHPTNPNKLWVTFSGYSAGNKIFTSTDGGTTWTNYSTGLPNLPTNCVVYQNGSSDQLYVGTDVGVYVRNSGMTDWTPYYTGLPNVIVTELEIYNATGKLRAATYGRGLWQSDLYTGSTPPVGCTPNFTATASANPATVCGGSGTTLNVAVSTSSASAYCASNATSAADTDIGNVTFAGINNGTASPVSSNTTATGMYTNNTAGTAASVTQGGTYTFSASQITSGATWYGGFFRVFIDYNFDGDFDDAGESVFTAAGTTTAAAPSVSASITIPSTANRGTTRLRVVLRESGTATTTTPCGTFSYGETEDYSIVIGGSSNGSYTYSWSPATGLSSSTVQNPTCTGSGTYTCTVTGAPGCSLTTSTTVSVTPSAALPLADVTFTSFTGADLSTVHAGWREGAGAATAAGTTSAWVQANATQETGFATRTARINLYTTSRNEWIVSPVITAASNTVLAFNVAVTDWNGTVADAMGSDDKVRVMISTNCGSSWTALATYNAASGLTTALTAKSVSLGAYAGQSVQVAFLAQDGPVDDANDYDFHLDNIRLYNGVAARLSGDGLAADLTVGAYPNPFTQEVMLRINSGAKTPVQLLLTDALGREVHRQSNTLLEGANEIQLSLDKSLPAGLYQLSTITEQGRLQQSLIKQ